ncbi:LOW QUALITY PROTEIN: U1 small nuclear ribonucleoprotein 70 kDa [Prosopis cineraria]|uniref:LOW QUALITY PROTEIN: U1 small nuclear ribonucleoprotein 70 kDa n=1 Tax=Prosopis cineraria TaxID=364024 RepID=UPI0024101777|nr:LOW QUALITY PROTEIN: U1 small nuclear ribonucleoprotein 70 kDa [Prosopis cineraria]
MGDYNDAAFMRNQNAAVQARTKAQNRANVLQLKLIGQSHPTGLTANLLKLFEPRPPLEYKPPPEKRKCPPLTGMAQFVGKFAEPGDPEYSPPVQEAETPMQRRARIHKLRLEKGAAKAAEELEKYDPHNDPNISGDPYKTLFVARLSYETTESRIKREFESYGPIKRVRLVTDKDTNKPKGYAFIEYLHTRDMKAAYKQADGRKIEGRRVLVDVERGRTVPNWRPRRLGGGLGTTRVGGEEVNQRNSGREQLQSGPSRSEEPKVREERQVDRDREKSRERGRDRDRERERSRERSHDRSRTRDHREDRHHRDRDRTRDRERERDRGRDRDRDRGRDRERGRDRDRERDRDRHRERDRDYEVGDLERGRSHDRESDYDRLDSKNERDRHGERERDYEPEDDRPWYNQLEHGHRHADPDGDAEEFNHHEHHQARGHYDRGEGDHYDQYPDRDRLEDDYHNEHTTSESRDRERNRDVDHEYHRSERSHSREYEY